MPITADLAAGTHWSTSRCRVCGRVFSYTGERRQKLCPEHAGSCDLPRGMYKVVTHADGLTDDQEDFLATMVGTTIKKMHMIDLAQGCGMNGAVVEHVASGTFYKIESSQFVIINKRQPVRAGDGMDISGLP